MHPYCSFLTQYQKPEKIGPLQRPIPFQITSKKIWLLTIPINIT